MQTCRPSEFSVLQVAWLYLCHCPRAPYVGARRAHLRSNDVKDKQQGQNQARVADQHEEVLYQPRGAEQPCIPIKATTKKEES